MALVAGERFTAKRALVTGAGSGIGEAVARGLHAEGAEVLLADVRAEPVDLIAMTTHGHRFISDLLYGATVDKVRHEVDVPVLLLKVKS